MAEEKMEHRPANLRQFFPWFELFRAFQVALDPKKLVLAAAGILAMAFWWWICSVVFYAAGGNKPQWTEFKNNEQKKDEQNWADFKAKRRRWNLLHETAGYAPDRTDAGDLADNWQQYDVLNRILTDKPVPLSQVPELAKRKIVVNETEVYPGEGDQYVIQRHLVAGGNNVFTVKGPGFDPSKTYVDREKPYGRIRTWPFFENRGPNPYLLVFGQVNVPREEGVFHWFVFNQVPVLVEPVVKFVLPIYYLLHTDIGVLNFLYFALVLLGTLAVWALFGGAITRMAAVQVARREKIGLSEAMRFTLSKWGAFFSAPLFPLLGVVIIALLLIIYGFFHLIPVVGDIIVDGLGWPLALLLGLVMAVILVGLVSWPMMYATISAEGSDSFDALSRSYSYVIQSPWHYLWYVLVTLVYGAVVVFFVGFMGSLAVYLAKWGVSENPFTGMTHRDPSYLFVYSPTSWDWRTLLMQGGEKVNPDGTLQPGYFGEDWHWYNYAGAFMVSVIWINLAFLLILGFAYSFFWSAGTITYLLMRRHVDDTDMDEVYLDEEEAEEAYTVPPPAPAAAAPPGPNLTMVEAPTLKTSTATVAPPPPTSSTAVAPPRVEPSGPPGGDGNPPPPA